jgi:hypothetical protein
MAWTDAINDIVNRYAGGTGGAASAPANPHEDYRNIAASSSPQVMADALAHTFRSDQTPSFPEMVSSLFRSSNPDQKAGLLSQLLASVGPGALASLPQLKDLCGSLGGQSNVTSAQAAQIPAEQVQLAAAHAQQNSPSIIDRVSSFYAQHPDAVKGLGAAAITIAIQKIARGNR